MLKDIDKYLAYANLPIFGFFVWAMAKAKFYGWNRWFISGLFFLYCLVRVLLNLYRNRTSVLMAGEMIQTMKQMKKKKVKKLKR